MIALGVLWVAVSANAAWCCGDGNRVGQEAGGESGEQGGDGQPAKKGGDRRWSSLFPRPMWQAPYRGDN